MYADTILTHFSQIFAPNDPGHPLTKDEMSEANVIADGYIAIKDGKIQKVGSGEPDPELIGKETEVVDYTGKIATPGLIDCHTHLVYGGSREHEFSLKLNGASYLEILNQGGGIHSTVSATRKSSFAELYEKTKRLLDYMCCYGTTTVEAKSGYGLNWETEERQLRVIEKLNQDHPLDLIPTFMAAHAVPKEYAGRSGEYIQMITAEMLPKVKADHLAEFCDIFCEKDVFTADESYQLLKAAQDMGFKLRIHADEIESIGGVEVAAKLHATSAEHLMMITDESIQAMADNQVIGNLLPGTTFSLMQTTYAPAKKMIEAGVPITLSTDSNPGSCPTINMQFIMQLGCFQMKLTPIQVLNAVTINAAYSIDRADTIGSLDVDKQADIAIFDCSNIDYPLYFFATNLVSDVYKRGQHVVHKGVLVEE
ncbi:MAG: imidazolonepropionase [Aerococcus sp.]|nr:imidazolonepropionase [Aerococcus sp.]